MLETIKLSLRGYKKEPYSFIETINCKEIENRFEIIVIEPERTLYFPLEDDADDLIDLVKKIELERTTNAVIVNDNKHQIHYYKRLK